MKSALLMKIAFLKDFQVEMNNIENWSKITLKTCSVLVAQKFEMALKNCSV